jgi:gamma-glutamylcyclotransferase (GGCT)/AIG2-like uncharacterized protein YtfP
MIVAPAGRRRLFVYGTLMLGEANAGRLTGATRLGPAATLAAFDLLDLGGGYPALRVGGRTSVRGELYLVDDATVAALDEFEGHPKSFTRTEIGLSTGGSAEAYLVPAAGLGAAHLGARPIPGGDWRRRRR